MMQVGLTLGLGAHYKNFPVFSPKTIAGIELWADTSDLSTIIQSGGAVSQWHDKSGQGRHLVQETGSLQPVTGTHTQKGLNVLACDGSSVMGMPAGVLNSLMNGGETTLYAVFCSSLTSSTQRIFAEQGPTRYGLLLIGGRLVARHHTSTSNQATASSYTPNAAHIATMKRSGSAVHARLNNTVFSTAAANSFLAADTICAAGRSASPGQDLNGWIAEIILYSRILSEDEDARVMGYLKEKWATT